MNVIAFAVCAVVALAGLFAAVAALMRREAPRAPVIVPRRAYELEARIRTVLTGPRQKYGDIFTDYSVWRTEAETRLEMVAGDPWKQLNEFTRCLVVRYLWRVLESLAGGAVVVIDDPSQVWNEEVDAEFRDQGFDWKTFGHGPQFVNEG